MRWGLAGKGQLHGGKSGRPTRPERPQAGLGPIYYLRSVVADANAPRRDRGAAARALLAQQARSKRDKKVSRADERWQQTLEAGWWSHWHVGFQDPTVYHGTIICTATIFSIWMNLRATGGDCGSPSGILQARVHATDEPGLGEAEAP